MVLVTPLLRSHAFHMETNCSLRMGSYLCHPNVWQLLYDAIQKRDQDEPTSSHYMASSYAIANNVVLLLETPSDSPNVRLRARVLLLLLVLLLLSLFQSAFVETHLQDVPVVAHPGGMLNTNVAWAELRDVDFLVNGSRCGVIAVFQKPYSL